MKKKLYYILIGLFVILNHSIARTIDGVSYELSPDLTAKVVQKSNPQYLGEITIPSTITYNGKTYKVTSIGNEAFKDCSFLFSVTIPNSVTSIGERAFQSCKGLSSVTIPNSVTSIGEIAFWGCSNLTSITIPNSVTSIGNDAFACCSNLTTVTISNSVTSIGNGVFNYCNLDSISVAPENPMYDSRNNCNAIIETSTNTLVLGCKNTIIPNSITSIGVEAFHSCNGLSSFTIPNSVTSIGERAFYNCSSLTSITIPNSVTSIGVEAFAYCSSLASVTIPNSVTSIGDWAFRGCSSLTSITIPNSVTSIGERAFLDCSSLTSITIASGNPTYDSRNNCNAIIETSTNTLVLGCNNTIIPNTVTSIGKEAFNDYSSLTSITIPNSVTSIGIAAFGGCSGLTSITIPSSVTSIENGVFSGCSSLTSITIPNSVTSIGPNAFWGCSSLTSITIPNSVTSIGYNAFWGCSSLTSITIPNSVTSIGNYAFNDCSSLTSITIPNSVTSIGSAAFGGCSSLTSITIPNSVTSIGEWAFRGCSGLTSITIPTTCGTRIEGDNLFPSVGNLSYIFVDNPNPPEITRISNFASWIFEDVFLCVPTGARSSYQNAFFWNFFKNIVSFDSISVDAEYGESTILRYDSISADIVITPDYGYHFTQWLDGNTDNPRNVLITQDTSFTAEFAKNLYSLSVMSTNAAYGLVQGSDTAEYLDTLTISATPYDGYYFVCWSDGNRENPRRVVLTHDKTFTAIISDEVNHLSIQTNIPGACSLPAPMHFFENDTYPLSVVPNYGYHFVQWSDGNTDNPRNITITQDSVFTAEFAKNQYSIFSMSTNSTFGVVQGSSTAEYLDTVSIIAAPNYGYHLVKWLDGNTDNPRNIVITQDTAFLAEFAINQYSLLVNSNNESAGIVHGSADAEYLETLEFSATPNYGYHFVQWSDGNTDNPRSVVLTQDSIFTAEFEKNLYSLLVNSDNESVGIVQGSATAAYLDTLAITATPNYGYHFVQWSDGLAENPRSVVLTKDTAFTAEFAKNQYSLSVNTENVSFGTALGSTTADYLETLTISATPVYGYYFTQWADGNTDNPRSIVLTQDTAFTAEFAKKQYSLAVVCDNDAHGIAQGASTAEYLETLTISATPNYGYHFVQWSDGLAENPRSVVLTKDTTFIAEFAANQYSILVNSDDNTLGTTHGSATAEYLETLSISATPNYGYHFTQWSDGNTDNPRNIVLTQDTAFTAEFAKNSYEVIIQSSSQREALISETRQVEYLDTIEIAVLLPDSSYRFMRWDDGNTDNPRFEQITQNSTFNALISNIYLLSASSEQGTVIGSGEYVYGSYVSLTAIPDEGYEFLKWSDESMYNPYIFVLDRDVKLEAIMAPVSSDIMDAESEPSKAKKIIKDGIIYILKDGKMYDLFGNIIEDVE